MDATLNDLPELVLDLRNIIGYILSPASPLIILSITISLGCILCTSFDFSITLFNMLSFSLNSLLNRKSKSSSEYSSKYSPLSIFHHAVKHLSLLVDTNCFKSLSFVQIIQFVPCEFKYVDQW